MLLKDHKTSIYPLMKSFEMDKVLNWLWKREIFTSFRHIPVEGALASKE